MSLLSSGIKPREKLRVQRINCVNNLHQVNLALRVWEEDNNNRYPMAVSVTNHGTMELIDTGNVAACFQSLSNQLVSPKILVCPCDTQCVPATNFTSDFNNSHVSYFLSPDASETYPQMVLDGDDNLAVNDVPVQPGILAITNPATISFTATRHINVGNIGYADGSASEVSTLGLQNALAYATNGTPFATNRLAIP